MQVHKWEVVKKDCAVHYADLFGISPILERVMINRGVADTESASVYLNPNIKYLHDIRGMKDVEKSFAILKKAVEAKKKICIYGDYDADGVCSCVILAKGLRFIGADLFFYIPKRETEGYGLNPGAVNTIHEEGAELIIACDNGIAAIEEIKLIKELGMDIIVIDHHEPRYVMKGGVKQDILPCADAVIDAKQADCHYPFKNLCAGGMCYKYIRGFYEYIEKKLPNEAELFAFAAVATVCDVVELTDENRVIVRNGLKLINNRDLNVGLSSLIRCSGLDGKKINEHSLGFVIGPCINVCGRIASAYLAVELFTTDIFTDAEKIANEIWQLNSYRKSLTDESFEKAVNIIENSQIKNDKVLVVYSENFNEAVIGIAAGRIKERYYRPTVMIAKGEKFDKGSARSIEEYNIFDGMLKCSYLFEKFGGHSMAAGLSIKHENVDEFRRFMNESCTLTNDDLTKKLKIDDVIGIKDVTMKAAKQLDLMRPVGNGNENALFLSENVRLRRVRLVGAKKNIMQATFQDDDGNAVKAIDFDGYERYISVLSKGLNISAYELMLMGVSTEVNLLLDIVYSININEWNGISSVQLNIVDFRESGRQ